MSEFATLQINPDLSAAYDIHVDEPAVKEFIKNYSIIDDCSRVGLYMGNGLPVEAHMSTSPLDTLLGTTQPIPSYLASHYGMDYRVRVDIGWVVACSNVGDRIFEDYEPENTEVRGFDTELIALGASSVLVHELFHVQERENAFSGQGSARRQAKKRKQSLRHLDSIRGHAEEESRVHKRTMRVFREDRLAVASLITISKKTEREVN